MRVDNGPATQNRRYNRSALVAGIHVRAAFALHASCLFSGAGGNATDITLLAASIPTSGLIV